MEISSTHQMYVFCWCIVSGMLCGVFFDLQRFLRRVRFAGGVRTMLEDILFALVSIAVTIGFGFYFNNGEMRYYQIMGSISGAMFYAAFLSRFVMGVFMTIYKLFKMLIIKPVIKVFLILMIPVKKLFYIIKKLCIKGRKLFQRVFRNIKFRKKRLKKRMKML